MAALNIYKLVRTDDGLDYNDPEAAIVVAATPGDAREMAMTIPMPNRNPAVWYLSTTSVTLVGTAAPLFIGQVLLVDHTHG